MTTTKNGESQVDHVGPGPALEVEHFAQIVSAHVELGDLTVLVGPQGAGKSLLLQLLKLALDRDEVSAALLEAGYDIRRPVDFLQSYLGLGMGGAVRSETRVRFSGKSVPLRGLSSVKSQQPGRLFYIPAQRAILLSDGWPAPFMKLTEETPVVARLFSQNLFQLFANPKDPTLFPVARRLKDEYRKVIDDAVFHGGQVQLETDGLKKRLSLRHGDANLPFMNWTAGQREFTPLLLGLYHLLPARKQRKQEEIDWVVIEEPEMGLHPQAIAVVMLLVLDLLWRGYRVVLSTHAPLVLDIVWALAKLRGSRNGPKALANAFGVQATQGVKSALKTALEKTTRTYAMAFDPEGSVRSVPISQLDPSSDNAIEAGWGGLTGWSSSFMEAISEASPYG